MSDDVVLTQTDGAIGTITINRPKALNALNRAVIEALLPALNRLAADPKVRVIVLTGAGDRAFVAGADINEFVGAGPQDAIVISQRLRSVTDVMAACPKPVLASIRGFCLGGGFELALAADLRIASADSRFGQPEIKLGVMPGGGGAVRLTKMVGTAVARQMTMIGEPIDAERAFQLGLVASIHPAEELAAATAALANTLAARPPLALAQLKSTLNVAMDASSAVALDTETKAFALCYATEDKAEGVRAFLEKRSANFTGK